MTALIYISLTLCLVFLQCQQCLSNSNIRYDLGNSKRDLSSVYDIAELESALLDSDSFYDEPQVFSSWNIRNKRRFDGGYGGRVGAGVNYVTKMLAKDIINKHRQSGGRGK